MPPPVPIPAGGFITPDFDVLAIRRSFCKATACGPSDLCIQHLLNAAEVPLQTPMIKRSSQPSSFRAGTGSSFQVLSWRKVSQHLKRTTQTVPQIFALLSMAGKCLCAAKQN